MDSLPSQPIDSLPPPAKKEAYRQLANFCLARSLGINSEEQLAESAGFSNVEVMRISLSNWGLSALLPRHKAAQPPSELALTPKTKELSESKRKAQSSGDAEELPLGAQAVGLFKEALKLLNEDVNRLSKRHEHLQAERFSAYEHWHNKNFDAEQREFDNQQASRDPGFHIGPVRDRFYFFGAGWHPLGHLTVLIAVYALLGESLPPLVEALHPKPHEADLAGMRKLVEATKKEDGKDGLRRQAEQLARMVRGERLRKGQYPAEVSPQEHSAAYWIKFYDAHGLSDTEIGEKLCGLGYDLDRKKAEDEVRRIRALRLETKSE